MSKDDEYRHFGNFTIPIGMDGPPWPADLVKGVASGSPTTPPSRTLESEVSPTQFAILIDALREQTAAITKLVRSNEALIEAMSQVEADPDAPPSTYLSGKRI